ncbi:ammosamide/lymphostin RiPP family protein [Streptomyces sp. I05A-00742]|uniref:ammosamide/lymphostin RiPP family protein n=1 Tax=Streptomyces sp. I05A-00742 TaxID=2732853 RepID=UPI0037DA4345
MSWGNDMSVTEQTSAARPEEEPEAAVTPAAGAQPEARAVAPGAVEETGRQEGEHQDPSAEDEFDDDLDDMDFMLDEIENRIAPLA